jgi:hypothetical protein
VLDALTYAGNPQSLEGTRAELVVGDIRDQPLVERLLTDRASTPSSTSPPKAMSTAPSMAPPPSSTPTSSAPSRSCKPPAPPG